MTETILRRAYSRSDSIALMWRRMLIQPCRCGPFSPFLSNCRSFGSGRNQASESPNPTYKCGVCGACFRRRSSLWNHSKLHSSVRHYGCAVCDKRYKWKNSLRAHAEVHLRKKEISSLEEIPDLKKLLRKQPKKDGASTGPINQPIRFGNTSDAEDTERAQQGEWTSGVHYNLPGIPTSPSAFRPISGLGNCGAIRGDPFGMNGINGTSDKRGMNIPMYCVGNGVRPIRPLSIDYGLMVSMQTNVFQSISVATMGHNLLTPQGFGGPHILPIYGTNPLNQGVPLMGAWPAASILCANAHCEITTNTML